MIKTFIAPFAFFLFYTIAVWNHDINFSILFGIIFLIFLAVHLLVFAHKFITG